MFQVLQKKSVSSLKFLSILFLTLASLQVQAAVWVAQNSWNDSWEKKYSEWLANEVTPQFFQNYQISTDCADAVISLRWIFARINSLPAAATVGSSITSNLSSRWDQLGTATTWNKDARFMAAIKEINSSTDTKSLYKDLYPIKLNAQYLAPGAIYINATQSSGHAEWISKNYFDGINNPITFYSSTVPKQIRETLVYPFMKTKWPEKGAHAFMRFRWAIQSKNSVQMISPADMPGFSLEQFELASQYSSNYDFDDFVTTRLVGQPLDGLRKLQNLVSYLAQRIENRVPVVQAGFQACQKGCAPESSAFYSHSTYSRDAAIQFLIIGITELIYSDKYVHNVDDQLAGQMVLRWSQLQNDIVIDLGFKQTPLGYLVNNWNMQAISSDPNQPIEKRWGF